MRRHHRRARFGGDLKLSIFTAACWQPGMFSCRVTVVCMGPGVAGTGAGFSGMEVADNLNRTYSLEGRPIVLPRASFADRRRRHQSISSYSDSIKQRNTGTGGCTVAGFGREEMSC